MINEALATVDDISYWAPAGSCASIKMLRLDRLHPVVSGNKWYKLKYNAAAAAQQGKSALLTFGGGYSNHLAATAFAARELGLKSIGLIRGHYSGAHFTSTLQACLSYGMQLLPLSKSDYMVAKSGETLQAHFPDAFIIPEGGANKLGIRGAAEIALHLPDNVTDVCLAMGSGTTLNGLYAALPQHVRLHGFYAAKDFENAGTLVQRPEHVEHPELLLHHVEDSRFGKWTSRATDFVRSFHQSTGIPLDMVYTSKMMIRLQCLLQESAFGRQRNIVCIHTGGLQGNPPGLFS